MKMLVGITGYAAAVIISFFLVKYTFKYGFRSFGLRRAGNGAVAYAPKRISLTKIMIIAIIFVIYNYLMTRYSEQISGDRQNYALSFYGIRDSASEGLMFVIRCLKRFSANVEILYYFSTFATVALMLFAYKYSRIGTPIAVLFVLTTQYVLFSFAGMKQCYANGFASLCVIFALRNEGIKDKVLSIVCIVLSVWFHHTGYFLIPIVIAIHVPKNRVTLFFIYTVLISTLLAFKPALYQIIKILSPIVPTVANKLSEYLGETANNSLEAAGAASVLKGLPFYGMSICGVMERKRLRSVIKGYDNYLMICVLTAVIFLFSYFNSWIIRVSYFLYLPSAVLFSEIMTHVSSYNERVVASVVVYGSNILLTLRYIVLIFENYGGF